MNSWEYRLYYRENIWRSAVLACFAEKAQNFTQLEKHKSVMNRFIEGLDQIIQQKEIS